MPRETVHVTDELGLLRGSGGTAYAPAVGDRLAGDFALEGAEDELGFGFFVLCGGGGERVMDWGEKVVGVEAWGC